MTQKPILNVPEGVTLEQHLQDVIKTEDARLRRSQRLGDDTAAEVSAGRILGYCRALHSLKKQKAEPPES